MTEVSFYHLQSMPLERALPRLLERVVERGMRALVLGGSEERLETLNVALWTYEPGSFLAHGMAKDGHPEIQPIYLTANEENPNAASVLVLVDGADHAMLGKFVRCLDIFDGQDEAAVRAARERWKRRKDAGHAVAYWQQTPEGRWEQKA